MRYSLCSSKVRTELREKNDTSRTSISTTSSGTEGLRTHTLPGVIGAEPLRPDVANPSPVDGPLPESRLGGNALPGGCIELGDGKTEGELS